MFDFCGTTFVIRMALGVCVHLFFKKKINTYPHLGIFAQEMGMGKTFQAITVIHTYLESQIVSFNFGKIVYCDFLN